MTTTTIELTKNDIAHRKACAFLKGIIIRSSISNGMKWSGDTTKTPEFTEGFNTILNQDALTFAHIVYNRLRHNKPHRTSGKRFFDKNSTDYDESFIVWMLWEREYYVRPIINKLTSYGIDMKTLLSRPVVQKEVK